MARRAMLCLMLVMAWLANPGVAAAASWTPDPEDQLLLELRSAGYRLGDPLRGYQGPQGLCVDFADLIQALDLPLRIDKRAGRASGWLFAEDERLVIDRDAGVVQTNSGSRTLTQDQIVDTPEGWCVALNALSVWTGVQFAPDVGNLAIRLETDRKLPFLQAIERKSRAARLRAPAAGQIDWAQLPQASAPYRSWRSPSVDVQVLASAANQGRSTLQYEALAAGEAAQLSFTARLAGNDGLRPDSLRLQLYRNDAKAGLLGPLAATQVAIGDVTAQRGGLTGQSVYGRGLYVSNLPLSRGSRFGVTTLRGVLPAGWDAELYRNGDLRAYQADRGDGRYEFDEVELQFGENEFEVVLYGPQGQIRRERMSNTVGMQHLPPGRTEYWLAGLQAGRDLIELGNRQPDGRSGWRWGGGLEHGLDRRTTLGLEYQSLMRGGARRHYLEAVLRRGLGSMRLELAGAQQWGAGRAMRANALGRIGPIRFDAQALWVQGAFDSELINADQRREYSLRLGSSVRLGQWRLPVEGGIRRLRSRNGATVDEVSLRTGLRMGRTTLTTELLTRGVHTGLSAGYGGDTGTRLNLIGNSSIGRIRLRGSSQFRLSGQRRGFATAQLIAETAIDQLSSLRAGVDYDRQGNRREWLLGYVRQFRQFALRGEARADNRGGKSFGLTLGFSLGPDPVDGGWRLSRERLAGQGQASVAVFRDDNGDGLRQPDEVAVPGVRALAGFRHSERTTNQAGRAVIDGLTPYVPVVVAIDTGTLPDPNLRPGGRGAVVVPRPGVAARVELPLAPVGEIEAVLLGPDGEPRAGVPVELVDRSGATVQIVPSDYDGYLLFDGVPYGTYRLRLSPATAAMLGVAEGIDAAIRIDRANPALRLGQLRLQGRPPPAVAMGSG